MKCPECGHSLSRLISCDEHLEYESSGVPVKVITTEMYEQCTREECGYRQIENTEVEMERGGFGELDRHAVQFNPTVVQNRFRFL